MPSLRLAERVALEETAGFDGVVVCDGSLESLALGCRLAQLPAEPAEQADRLLVGRLCHLLSLRRPLSPSCFS